MYNYLWNGRGFWDIIKPLIKLDIPTCKHIFHTGIIHPISFPLVIIPHKDALNAFLIKFLFSNLIWYMSIGFTSKHSKILNIRFSSTPSFFRSNVLQNICGRSIQNIDVVLIAPAHRNKGRFLDCSIQHVISTKFLFFLSEIPFCWGVYLIVISLLIPWCSQNDLNLLFTYSPPLSILIHLILFPLSFSTRALKISKFLNASSFCFRN